METDYNNLLICFFQGAAWPIPFFVAYWLARQLKKYFSSAAGLGE